MRTKRAKRTTEITIERSRFVTVGRPRVEKPGRCPLCSPEAEMITPEQACSVAGVSVRTIYRWVETGRVHFIETREGLLFICVNSLSV